MVKGGHTNTATGSNAMPTGFPLPLPPPSIFIHQQPSYPFKYPIHSHFIKHFVCDQFHMNSGEFSGSTSPVARFFRQLLSPTMKSPTGTRQSSFSAPLPRGNSDDIHQVFNYFDENGDGKISPSELQNRLRKVGGEEVHLSDEEAEMAVRSSDADGDGMLGLDDFTKMMKEGKEDELREAFVMYSARSSVKDGCVITPRSLGKMMRRLGKTATVNECKTMIGRFDVNGDGVLDFDEFRAMMMN